MKKNMFWIVTGLALVLTLGGCPVDGGGGGGGGDPKVILGAGSPGAAGDGTITGLTNGGYYFVKTGSNWYGVKSDGTLDGDGTFSGMNYDSLSGTAITGLTNGTTYTVFQEQEQLTTGGTVDLAGKYNSVVYGLMNSGESGTLKSAGTTNARTVIFNCLLVLEARAGATVTDGLELEGDSLDFTFSATTGSALTLGAITAGDEYFTLNLTGAAFSTTITLKTAD